jgi:hypothetical protein
MDVSLKQNREDPEPFLGLGLSLLQVRRAAHARRQFHYQHQFGSRTRDDEECGSIRQFKRWEARFITGTTLVVDGGRLDIL